MTCEDRLAGIDFIGGTLVEYIKYGGGEWRGTVVSFYVKDNTLHIKTKESEANKDPFGFGAAHLSGTGCTVSRRGNFWEIDGGAYCNFSFAIAPAGVEIPEGLQLGGFVAT